jgi:pyrroline-5-carboxylate reductase
MAVDERRIAILGAGKIGEALLAGLLSTGWRKPEEIVVTGRREERMQELAERYAVHATLSNGEAVARAAVVVIAVKPQDFDGLLGEIAPIVSPEQTVLSVAAAIPTATIEQRLADGVPVVRAMPNTPATVHEGVAGVCAGAHADDEHVALAEEVLAHVGSVVRVPERYMDAVTAVSGSGPGLLRPARGGDDRGGHPARPLARDHDDARRPDDARHGQASARREHAPRRAA